MPTAIYPVSDASYSPEVGAILGFLQAMVARPGQGAESGDPDTIARRWFTLSGREREIAVLICREQTSREIARTLSISPETVKTHVEHILQKMEMGSRFDMRLQLKDFDLDTGQGVAIKKAYRPTVSVTITISL